MRFPCSHILGTIAALAAATAPLAALGAAPLNLRAAAAGELQHFEALRSNYSGLLNGRVVLRTTEYLESRGVPIPDRVSPSDLSNVTRLGAETYDLATVREGNWTFDGPYFTGTTSERVHRDSGNGVITVTEAFDGKNVTSLIQMNLDDGRRAMPTYTVSPDVSPSASHAPGDRRFLWFPFLRDLQKTGARATPDVKVVAELTNADVTAFATDLPGGKVRCSIVDRMTGQLRLVETLDGSSGKPIRQTRYEYATAGDSLPSRITREFGEPGTPGFRTEVAEIDSWQTIEGSASSKATDYRVALPSKGAYDLWDEGTASVKRIAMDSSSR